MRPSTARARRRLLERAERRTRRRHAEFDLTLNDIVEDLGTSRRQLQRAFSEGGESFRECLLRIRMERARRLLAADRKHPLSVREAARRVGYREASGLRQAFKRYWGLSPSDVRPHTDTERDFSEQWRLAEQSTSSTR